MVADQRGKLREQHDLTFSGRGLEALELAVAPELVAHTDVGVRKVDVQLAQPEQWVVRRA